MKIPFLVNSNNKWLDISSNNKNMDYRYNMRKILGKESLNKFHFKRKILIFTRYDDPEVDYLGKKLLENSIDYLRINIEDLLDNVKIDLVPNSKKNSFISYYDETISLNKIDAIWFRHFSLESLKFPKNYDDIAKEYVIEQWDGVFESLNNWNIKVINKYKSWHYLPKPIQLKIADEIGIKIPKTNITNAKFKTDKIQFMKAVMSHNIEVTPDRINRIYGKKANIKNINSGELNITPTIFQNALINNQEVRVTFFGSYFSSAVYQNVEVDDWHNQGIFGFNIMPYKIPDKVLDLLRKFKHKAQLNIGTIDLIHENNEWFFWEVNTSGDWRWLEVQSKQKISQDCINFLKEEL